MIEFSAGGDIVAKLERHYFLDESILRYLSLVLDKRALKARTAAALLAAEQPATETKPEEAPKAAPLRRHFQRQAPRPRQPDDPPGKANSSHIEEF